MAKVAQLVLTRTKDGLWHLSKQSLQRVESSEYFESRLELLNCIEYDLFYSEWEQLSLDP